ncbi:hypothetical protein PVK06_024339 [Gossypium arboreum]|uniref:Uncharacterized protein n=1 Tax=Gossypium arboreum TaxID=29729 RepID=A0ABR0PDH4_GOSAR|nr:hypothetical protein PVK06_024339 [Gossypium arboreum]
MEGANEQWKKEKEDLIARLHVEERKSWKLQWELDRCNKQLERRTRDLRRGKSNTTTQAGPSEGRPMDDAPGENILDLSIDNASGSTSQSKKGKGLAIP